MDTSPKDTDYFLLYSIEHSYRGFIDSPDSHFRLNVDGQSLYFRSYSDILTCLKLYNIIFSH